jgi:CRP/FNR family transcriptional regulator, dissimilatory nitrate respiration regulator
VNVRDAEALTQNPLFTGISVRRIMAELPPAYCRVEEFSPGERIFSQGQRCTELRVLLSGKANARIYEYSGKTVLVETLEAPAAAALGVIFSSDPYYPVTLEADTPVRAAVIARAGLNRLFQAEPEILDRVLCIVGDTILFLAEKVRLAELAGIRQRVADYILRLRNRFGSDDLLLPYSREKMAEMFGVARPSLSREISRMCEAGLISVNGRALIIHDPEALKSLLEL